MRFPPRAAAVLLLAGTACQRPSAAPTMPSMVRVGLESDPLSLDPSAQQEAATHSVLSNIYEALVAFDKDEKLVPCLASSWSSLDEHTWQIQLRSGVRFHDGRPFGAKDVKYTIERDRDDPASALRGHLSGIASVDVVDEANLRLVTKRPEALLMNRLTYILILPAGGLPTVLSHPIGTGPFRFVSWEKGKALRTEAFADYWGGRPAFDQALFIPVEEGEKSLDALSRHQVDVLRWVPEPMIERFQAASGVRVLSRPGLSSYYLWFNPQSHASGKNPFADRRVRRAISMAIDRPALVQSFGGRALAANQLVQPGVFGYAAELPGLVYDPEQGRALLAQAGYAHGFETKLVHRPQASLEVVAVDIRDMLEKIGIHASLETPDWATSLTRWRAGEIPFFLAGWRFEDGEVQSFLRDCLFTREPKRNYGSFNPGYSNPELDRLIEQDAEIFREDERKRHYAVLTRLALDDMPLVPLYHRMNFYGVASDIAWDPRLDGKLLAAEMSRKPPQ
jgi:peptide/nickel transport system substrate-binding protein